MLVRTGRLLTCVGVLFIGICVRPGMGLRTVVHPPWLEVDWEGITVGFWVVPVLAYAASMSSHSLWISSSYSSGLSPSSLMNSSVAICFWLSMSCC